MCNWPNLHSTYIGISKVPTPDLATLGIWVTARRSRAKLSRSTSNASPRSAKRRPTSSMPSFVASLARPSSTLSSVRPREQMQELPNVATNYATGKEAILANFRARVRLPPSTTKGTTMMSTIWPADTMKEERVTRSALGRILWPLSSALLAVIIHKSIPPIIL